MGWEHRTQRIRQQMLDLLVAGRDPGFLGDYMTDNTLMRALAHLVATDGNFSRLLRCTSGGVLQATLESSAGVALAIDESGRLNVRLYDSLGSGLRTGVESSLRVVDATAAAAAAAWDVVPTTATTVYIDLTAHFGKPVELTAAVGEVQVFGSDDGLAKVGNPMLIPRGNRIWKLLQNNYLAVESCPIGTADWQLGYRIFG